MELASSKAMRVHSSNGQPAPAPPSFPCWLEIDLDAIRANVRQLKRLIGPETALCAVVKAEAYGLGAVEVARAAVEAGADWLGVARLQEAIQLRAAGLDLPILNLTFTGPADAEQVVRHRITPTVAELSTARALAAAVPWGRTLDVHLKVDTGLSRFGAQPEELGPLVDGLRQLPSLRVDGLSSHFAAADEDLAFTRLQLARFHAAEREVRALGLEPRLRHIANSAATLALPESRLDLVRPGLTLSGHYPSPAVEGALALLPAVAFKAQLARVYDLPLGASVGYSRTFHCRRPTRAALVPAGYADGLPRAHSNRGAVLVRGRRAPVVGRVSMDQCVVDVTDVPGAAQGDEVVLFGPQGADEISLDEYAAWSDTIAHEALCRVGPRVPRCYVTEGTIREVRWLGRQEASSPTSAVIGSGASGWVDGR